MDMHQAVNQDRLEALIDSEGLGWVIDAISAICRGKAEHIRDNWQGTGSEPLAKQWDRNAKRIETCWSKLEGSKLVPRS